MQVLCGFCRASAEAKYDFGLSRTTLKINECTGILEGKQGAPEFVFSEKAFQGFADLLGHERSSDVTSPT